MSRKPQNEVEMENYGENVQKTVNASEKHVLTHKKQHDKGVHKPIGKKPNISYTV